MRTFLLTMLVISLGTTFSFAQSTGSLQGVVVDAATQQPLPGISIRLLTTTYGAVSSKNGSFAVKNLPANSYTVQLSCIGFTTVVKTDVVVRSGRSTFLNVELHQSAARTEDVTVRAEYFSTDQGSPVSTTFFSTEEIRRAPGSAGDINRVLSSSSSVGRVDDSRADITVRGGSPAENVFFVDNIPVININYFPKQGSTGGPISFLNISQVKSLNFMSGGFDATHNALSSVIDIKLSDGNAEQFAMQADLNMIGIGVSAEGPLKNQSSYYISVSRGYLDVLKGLLDQTGVPQWANAQTKISLKAGTSDRFSIIGFSAISDFVRDKTEAIETNTSVNHNQQWQNIFGCNWQHLFGDVGYANTSIAFNSIHSFETSSFPQTDSIFFDNETSLRAVHLRNQTHIVLSPKWEADIGGDLRFETHDLASFVPATRIDSVVVPAQRLHNLIDALHGDVFASLTVTAIDKLSLSVGMRADKSSYSGNRSLELVVLPRLSARVQLSDDVSFSAAAGKYSQPLTMGLLQYSLQQGFPSKAVVATHLVASLAWLVNPDTRLCLEAYHKSYENMPIDRDALYRSPLDAAIGDFDFNQTTKFRFDGTARSYGVELSLQKKLSTSLYCMLGASYMRSFYTDGAGIERSRVFDNRFLVNATAGWKIDERWEISAQASVVGGNAYTPLDAVTSASQGREVWVGAYMGDHLPVYKTLNLRADRRFHFESSNIIVYITALNALNLSNVKNVEWNPYSRSVTETHHIGILPILGIEWQL